MAKNKSSATKSTLTEIVNKTVKNRQRRKKLKTVLNEGCLFYYNELNQFSCEKK